MSGDLEDLKLDVDGEYAKKYEEGEEIGSGASSVVRLCTERATGKEFAVKIMSRKQTMMDEGKFASEIGIMRALNHPHIMGVQDVYKTKMKIKVVMELATGGELFERICDQNNFEEKQAQKLAGDLFKALAYMHSKGVAHRDLKPENILFLDESEDSPVKIADFGFAKMSGGKGGRRRMNTALGTQGYSAPEVFLGKPYTEKCDVWSMGVIIYILLCGLPPFIEIDEDDIHEAFNCPFWVYVNQMIADPEKLKLEFHPKLWGHVSEDAKDFLRKLFAIDPESRPSASELVKHPWISGNAVNSNSLTTTMEHLRRFKKDNAGGTTLIEPHGTDTLERNSGTSPHVHTHKSNASISTNLLAPSENIANIASQSSSRPARHTPQKVARLKDWDESKVAEWIGNLGKGRKWEQYQELAKKQGIDGVTLFHADVEALVKLGFLEIHAKAVIGEAKESLKKVNIVPVKLGDIGAAYAVKQGVVSVPVYAKPGREFKEIGHLGKGSVVHSLAESSAGTGWVKHRLGWSPKRDLTGKMLLNRIIPAGKLDLKSRPNETEYAEVDRNKQIHCGMLMKRSKHLRGWFKRFFVLYPNRLVYYRPGAAQSRGEIHLAIIKAVKTVGKYQFNVVAGQKTICLKAGAKLDRHEWIEKLQTQRITFRRTRSLSRGVRFVDSPLVTSSKELRDMEEAAVRTTRNRRDTEMEEKRRMKDRKARSTSPTGKSSRSVKFNISSSSGITDKGTRSKRLPTVN
ncbi:hypothetical protein AAMO2058_000463200 [Amorphochlora amoebiformis]